jgi:hypothetical protein
MILTKLAIKYLERDLEEKKGDLTDEQRNGLLASLWTNIAFRDYVKERDEKIKDAIANGIGLSPEPRDKYVQKFGQRVEILLLASRAKACWARRQKELEAKKENAAGQ